MDKQSPPEPDSDGGQKAVTQLVQIKYILAGMLGLTRVGIDSPNANFTEEGLCIKDGAPRVDRSIPSTGTAEDSP